MFPGFTSLDALTVEQIKIAMAAHGMSVVEIERVGRHRPVAAGRAAGRRRTTGGSPRWTPRSGSPARPPARPLLRTAADPAGATVDRHAEQLRRRRHPVGHGAVRRGELQPVLRRRRRRARRRSSRRWPATASPPRPAIPTRHAASGTGPQERFDLAKHPNEAQPVRLDRRDRPVRPGRPTPRKHTALGRFKHEGANVIVAKDGRVVAYMGDDERFDYLYKFVSDRRSLPARGDRPAQPDPAGVGHPVRRQVHRRQPGRRDRRHRQAALRRRLRRHRQVDPAGVAATARYVPGMTADRGARPSPGWPATRSARPRWTVPRTSSPTRSPARSTRR